MEKKKTYDGRLSPPGSLLYTFSPGYHHRVETNLLRKDGDRKENDRGYHERPLGGKADGCFPPSDVIRMNFIVLRLDQSPFHRRRAATTSSLVTSGNQNPVLSSLFSVSVRWSRASSRFAGGRPLRRSCCNCSISGTSRLIYLWRAPSKQMQHCRTGHASISTTYLVTISRISSSETVLDSSGMLSWKYAIRSTINQSA